MGMNSVILALKYNADNQFVHVVYYSKNENTNYYMAIDFNAAATGVPNKQFHSSNPLL